MNRKHYIKGEYSLNWIQIADDKAELWGENVGRESRNYRPKLVRKMSLDEANRLIEEAEKERALLEEVEKAKAQKKKARREWIDRISGTKFGEFEIGFSGDLEDRYGNYIGSLPQEPISDNELEKFVDELVANFCGE